MCPLIDFFSTLIAGNKINSCRISMPLRFKTYCTCTSYVQMHRATIIIKWTPFRIKKKKLSRLAVLPSISQFPLSQYMFVYRPHTSRFHINLFMSVIRIHASHSPTASLTIVLWNTFRLELIHILVSHLSDHSRVWFFKLSSTSRTNTSVFFFLSGLSRHLLSPQWS